MSVTHVRAYVRAELSHRIGRQRAVLKTLEAAQAQLPRGGDLNYRVRLISVSPVESSVDLKGTDLQRLLKKANAQYQEKNPESDTGGDIYVYVVLPRKGGQIEIPKEYWQPPVE